MNITKKIKKLLIDADTSLSRLAELLGTSSNNLNNKFKRNDLRISEIENIANVLGYKVKLKFVKKENYLEDEED